MAEIIKGTTPTIVYTFSTVRVSDISVAYLTIKQDGTTKLERDLTTATVGENSLSWTLTQAETLALAVDDTINLMLNWKLADGTRGASRKGSFNIGDNYKDEVI